MQEGGFVDFFSIVFDHHEIIYAEGVPAESLMVNDATVNRLPVELCRGCEGALSRPVAEPAFRHRGRAAIS